jgi:hypothetical protein
MTPVGASLVMPASIIDPNASPPTPAISAKTIGTSTSATNGESRLSMMSVMKVTTMPNPSTVRKVAFAM